MSHFAGRSYQSFCISVCSWLGACKAVGDGNKNWKKGGKGEDFWKIKPRRKWLKRSELDRFGCYEWPGEHCDYQSHISCVVKSHLSRFANLEDICSFFACRIRVVLFERPRVLSIQFGKIISEIPNRLTHWRYYDASRCSHFEVVWFTGLRRSVVG